VPARTTATRQDAALLVLVALAIVMPFPCSRSAQPDGLECCSPARDRRAATVPPRSSRSCPPSRSGKPLLVLAQIATGGQLGLTLLGETQDLMYARRARSRRAAR